MASCELVPAMFDPGTKQVIYNPGQTRTQKKDLVVTIAQASKTFSKGFVHRNFAFTIMKLLRYNRDKLSKYHVNDSNNTVWMNGKCKYTEEPRSDLS